jgi:hypothetical protein
MSESSRAAESHSENSAWYPGWRVTAASSVGVLFSYASILVYSFGIFLKPLADEFRWSRESISLAFAVAAMMIAACSPAIGWLLDRFGPGPSEEQGTYPLQRCCASRARSGFEFTVDGTAE